MSGVTTDLLDRFTHGALVVVALAVAALVLVRIVAGRQRGAEPLGIALVGVFTALALAAGARLALGGAAALLVVDLLLLLATLAFLSMARRYHVLAGNADLVREYETEYAQKEREARSLAQINEELRRLDEQKSEFLAIVSHELRTPLTAIIGYSRLLLQQVHGALSPKQIEHQEAIFRSAQRLTDLINDLLDVSRLETGRIELEPRAVDLRQALDQAVGVIRVAAEAKQITVRHELPRDLPVVRADPARLQQILVNLLGNAVKFTPNGGSVRVEGGHHKDQVWIAVEDTGAGIAKDELARIWDPFYQVESPMRRRHGGSGLGLAIVRRLVELHGGIVRAESEGENRGSRFTFTLPVSSAPAEAETEPDRVPERLLTGRRVLIVEDEKQNQALMRVVVEDLLGGRASVIGDGEEAVFEAMEHPPALILLDLMLPGLSGWEVARRLRQSPRTRGVPIIAVSALARSQEREAALHAGCDAYLAKPFAPEEMARVIGGTLMRGAVAS